MKIVGINQEEAIERSKDVQRNRQPAESSDFKSVFEEEVTSLSETSRNMPSLVKGPGELNVGAEVQSVFGAEMLWHEVREAAGVARAVGEKLDGIDMLVRDSGSSFSLRQMDETIEALSREANILQDKVKGLPQDHPLRNIGDELSVLAYVESIKWKRGDYS